MACACDAQVSRRVMQYTSTRRRVTTVTTGMRWRHRWRPRRKTRSWKATQRSTNSSSRSTLMAAKRLAVPWTSPSWVFVCFHRDPVIPCGIPGLQNAESRVRDWENQSGIAMPSWSYVSEDNFWMKWLFTYSLTSLSRPSLSRQPRLSPPDASEQIFQHVVYLIKSPPSHLALARWYRERPM